VDPDGRPRCDCTILENSGNCTCIIECPPGGGDDDFETEGGGSS
jgi:hypothetical protein